MAVGLLPRFNGTSSTRADAASSAPPQSRNALRAPLFDGEPTVPIPLPRVTLVTRTLPAFTFFGVEPSLIMTYFPKGRPPKAPFPRLVLRKYAAAFLAFCDMSHMLNDDVELCGCLS